MIQNLNSAELISRIAALLIALPIHEFAHAFTAVKFGDQTPRIQGRLTLNPLKHLDPMGSLMLIVAGFGWAKPVIVDPAALHRSRPSAFMWVALAGPMSNLLLAAVAAIPFQLGLVNVYQAFVPASGILPTFPQFLVQFVYINLVLMIFNLIPIYPLDGEKILYYFVPHSFKPVLDSIRQFGPVLLLLVIFVGPMFGFDLIGTILGPTVGTLFRFLTG